MSQKLDQKFSQLNSSQQELLKLRHTTEHVLHTAMQNLYPQLKKAMGPATDDGFYFDFDLDQKISESDFPKIEAEMQKLIDTKAKMVKEEISVTQAQKIFSANPYKLEWLEDIQKRGESVSTYKMIDPKEIELDVDLCSGPHLDNLGQIKAFKLLSVAGAYWHGDEKNKMLTRIYGTCWPTQKELEDYLTLQEEIKKRDHRKLGKDLEIFTFAEDIGPGLPLWLPNGTIVKDELEKWGKETEKTWGYLRVSTPFLTKRDLFVTSGHVPYFEDEMYKVTVPGENKEETYFIKPMNCPFHHMIFKNRTRSYRDLPLKLAEYGTVARYENAGALNGILRPRLFVQNDAHVYCTEDQAVDVFVEIINLHKYYYDTLGLKDYHIVLCLRDPKKLDKYHGEEELWQKSETMSRQAMEKSGIKFTVENEGAAHYGPKMDFKIKSAIGTEYGISTNQIDLFMPRRFDLKYIDKDGLEKYVVVQHRAPLGSSERFVGFLLEHFGGAFPTWLAPVQTIVLPITDKHIDYAQKVHDQLISVNIRSHLDLRNEPLSARIRDAELQKVPYILVVGDREIQNESVSVRKRGQKDQISQSLSQITNQISEEIKNKSLL